MDDPGAMGDDRDALIVQELNRIDGIEDPMRADVTGSPVDNGDTYRRTTRLGNPDLQPEEGWAWDAGIELTQDPWRCSVVYFERHETDLIDWARVVDLL